MLPECSNHEGFVAADSVGSTAHVGIQHRQLFHKGKVFSMVTRDVFSFLTALAQTVVQAVVVNRPFLITVPRHAPLHTMEVGNVEYI